MVWTPPPPLKNNKNIGFSTNIGRSLKIHSYQTSIQCLAIIGTPAKRHLMAFRWRGDDGQLIVVLGSTLPSSTKKIGKKIVKVGHPLTKLSGSAHVFIDKLHITSLLLLSLSTGQLELAH